MRTGKAELKALQDLALREYGTCHMVSAFHIAHLCNNNLGPSAFSRALRPSYRCTKARTG
jgi:hypothetical protein